MTNLKYKIKLFCDPE